MTVTYRAALIPGGVFRVPQLMSAVTQQLQNLASGISSPASQSSPSSMLTGVGDFNTLAQPVYSGADITRTFMSVGNLAIGSYLTQLQAAKAAAEAATAPAVTAGTMTPEAGVVRSAVFADVNIADQVGRLSVPQTWTAAAPGAVPAAEPVAPARTGFRALPAWAANLPADAPGGMPTIGQVANVAGRRGGNAVFRMRDRRYRMPRPALGG